MKKGLLSILASALLVVGCQNYDDQFTNLESQISALATTVAGLSQVQSDLSTLAGTVNSLQSALSGQIDTALADGLADIDAAIAQLEAATADVATTEDVQTITDAVAANQEDLEELLAQSSVFQGDLVVSTPAMLQAYWEMGSAVAIINGYVDIDVSSDMDITKVQDLVNEILVTTEDFAYTAGTGVDTEITFSNLTGTRSLTLDQEGGYMLEALESATIITLDDDSSVDVVHLGSLTSVTSLSDGTGAGTFTFSKATELHLTSLPRYTASGGLSVGVDEGGVIAMGELTDLDAAGEDYKLVLSIDGPDTVSISKISGDKTNSQITLSNVINATLAGYDGKVVIGDDVQNFTSDNLVDVDIDGNDLVTFTATGALNGNSTTADTAGPALTLSSQGDLETVTLDGTFTTVSIGSNGNLVTATIGGTVTGADGVSLTSNSDLTTIDVSALTTDKVNIDGNSDLEALTLDFTTAAGEATTQEGTIIVNDNESLETLTIGANNIDNLTITNNADLTTIEAASLTAIGAKGSPSVTITDNDFNATVSNDEDDEFTTDSGMNTLKVYLTAVAADADSNADVKFDTVDSVVDASGVESASDAVDQYILTLTAKDVSTAASDAILEKRAWELPADADGFGITIGSTVVTTDVNSSTANNPTTSIDLDANKTLALAQVAAAASITRAASANVTLNAYLGGSPTVDVTFYTTVNTSTNGENYSDAAAGARASASRPASAATTTGTYVTLTVGSLSVTATTVGGALGDTHSVGSRWAKSLVDAWNTKYGGSGSSNTMSLVDTATVQTDATSATLTLPAKAGSGRRAHEMAVALSLTVSGVTDTVDWKIGSSDATADNKLQGDGIILVLEELVTGALNGVVLVSGTTRELSSTLLVQTGSEANTSTTANIYPNQARGDGAKGTGGDVVNDEGDVEEVSTPAVSENRVTWLAD
ncbi:hypothetical protein N9D50_03635 [Flavobacteriaceae bacterium]|nr:hypothetical protein [Flavobacteriaceae bacterium]